MKAAPGLLCLMVICLILVAGLWPFHAPANNVTLAPGDRGIRFAPFGVVFSKAPVVTNSTRSGEGFTLEVSLMPNSGNQSATVLAFSSGANPELLRLKQSNADLLLASRGHFVYIDNIFHLKVTTFLTIVANGSDLCVYVDGRPLRRLQFPVDLEDIAGQIVIGTSPVQNEQWAGEISGLAIYTRPLTEQETVAHYQAAVRRVRFPPADTGAAAVFSFGNIEGGTIRDFAPGGADLYVPDHYTILREKRFEPFWQEATLKWGYWKNALINVAGFVPLGLAVYGFLLLNNTRHALLATIAFGFAVSFTIELLQSYLPTRDSGTTDLITNTAGTAVGALLLRRVR